MATSHDRTSRLDGTGRADAEELFTACHPALISWVRRHVAEEEVASDITAEAFARLLGRWTRIDNPRSYLYAIAANLIKDHWRRISRERNAVSRAYAARTTVSAWQPAEETDLRVVIEALPQRLRAEVLLYYGAGFQVREVAAMVGRPAGTVKADLYRARARLKAGLADTAA
jgi:RNA polymerase sigma-70 factor (ECF subfamily)